MKYKMIPKFNLDQIEEITLLSSKEWEEARKITTVPRITGWWWLRSHDRSKRRAAFVDTIGHVHRAGDYVINFASVRPAFKIPNLKLKIGTKIFVKSTVCTVIDDGYALSDNVICKNRYDPESNDYEKSEIKRYINSDEFKKML